MKKFAITFAVSFVLPFAVFAASFGEPFSQDLFYGLKNDSDVIRLQQFLSSQGYFSEEATGNYFNVTTSAVQELQRKNGINPTGYFGPVTRALVNSGNVIGLSSSLPTISLTSTSAGTIGVNMPQIINWQTQGMSPEDVVTVSLLKQVSSNPATYELVRQVLTNVPNTGAAVWMPLEADAGQNLILQVSCSTVSARGCASRNDTNTTFALAPIGSGVSPDTQSRIASIQAAIGNLMQMIKNLSQ